MTRDEALIALAVWCLKEAGWGSPSAYGVGDLDGAALQDEAQRLGLLIKRPHSLDEGCGDESCEYKDCRCDGGTDCDLLFMRDDVRPLMSVGAGEGER